MGGYIVLGVIFLVKVDIYSLKIVMILPEPIRGFTVKKNHIGAAVSEIHRYRQKSLLLYITGYENYIRKNFFSFSFNFIIIDLSLISNLKMGNGRIHIKPYIFFVQHFDLARFDSFTVYGQYVNSIITIFLLNDIL